MLALELGWGSDDVAPALNARGELLPAKQDVSVPFAT